MAEKKRIFRKVKDKKSEAFCFAVERKNEICKDTICFVQRWQHLLINPAVIFSTGPFVTPGQDIKCGQQYTISESQKISIPVITDLNFA